MFFSILCVSALLFICTRVTLRSLTLQSHVAARPTHESPLLGLITKAIMYIGFLVNEWDFIDQIIHDDGDMICAACRSTCCY